MLDADGAINPIFTPDGETISRRTASTFQVPCGLLVNLNSAQELFESEVAGSNVDDNDYGDFQPERSRPSMSVFPQAGLYDHGHLQADGIPTAFHSSLAKINEDFRASQDQLDDDMSDDNLPPLVNVTVLTGNSCQLYNESMHRASENSSAHLSQQGTITAAFTGEFAKSAREKTIAGRKLDSVRMRLPFEVFDERMSIPNCPRTLRCENCFTIYVAGIDPTERNGQ
jgi:hypothetical protein